MASPQQAVGELLKTQRVPLAQQPLRRPLPLVQIHHRERLPK